jgi:hypothetical protein
MTPSMRASRRYDVPPLWLVPFAVIAGVFAIVFVATALSILGLLVAGYAVWRLERWADGYVRTRDALRD